MTTLTQIIFVILAIFLGWQLYRYIHINPQMFSRENLSRSIFTMGIFFFAFNWFCDALCFADKTLGIYGICCCLVTAQGGRLL